ncbi:MAG: hypothetical protein H7A55_23935 [Verrucomicrobiaceae bacterium]|nr:hypothetical protein [Verrucomicrobiaceae bacterium]
MKSLANIFRASVVSLESCCIGIGVVLSVWPPSSLNDIAKKVAANGEMIQYLSLAPVGIFVWVFAHSRKMLFPDADEKRVLQGWPDYRAFKEIVFVGVGYSVVFIVIGLSTWAMDWSESPVLPFVWMCISIVGAAVTAFSMYHAEIVLNEHLATEGEAGR